VTDATGSSRWDSTDVKPSVRSNPEDVRSNVGNSRCPESEMEILERWRCVWIERCGRAVIDGCRAWSRVWDVIRIF